MTHSNAIWDQLKPYLMAFQTHAWLWVIPTVALTVGSVFYALYMPATWKASQVLEVRDEVIGNHNSKGQFDSVDWMKVYQEKILEVARSRVVAEAVLVQLGPPPTHLPGLPWPTETDIADMQSAIAVNAPKGAEFGRTKTLHLSVTSKTPESAIVRCQAVCSEVEKNLGNMRIAHAQSLIVELEGVQSLAQTNLDAATSKLEELEREVGEDLGELRLLSEQGGGESNLRTTLHQISQELRQVEGARESLQQLKDLLEKSTEETLLATPSRLLDSQPGLRSLKEGLSATLLELSKLRGIMSEFHPKVQQAKLAELQIRRQLQDEVATAIRGIEADLASNAAQISTLQTQRNGVQQRLDRLATLRARYNNLVSESAQCTKTLDDAKRQLSDAYAAKSAAISTSQVTRFGEPVAGDRPIGPSKKLVIAGGLASGLTLGAGLVFLCMPISVQAGQRRWSDLLNMSRRATDQIFRRRASDTVNPAPPMNTATVSTMSTRAADPQDDYLHQPVIGGRRNGDIPIPPAIAPIKHVPSQPTYPEIDRRSGTGRRASDEADFLP